MYERQQQQNSSPLAVKNEGRGRVLVLSGPDAPIFPRYLTIKQAASYTGAAVWAIRRLLWGGHVRYTKLGRRFVVDRLELDSYMAGGQQAA